MDVRIATFARGKTTMWSGLARQAAITATFAKQFKFTKLVITGYTNPGGSLAMRTQFTQARALTVARFLTARLRAMGITNVQVVAAGAGRSLYNSRTLTTRQRQLNRSVVATLSYK
jgi:outer membrane protein OmpA-like peptidoglycan-associated protein